jgi:hypothetical protein
VAETSCTSAYARRRRARPRFATSECRPPPDWADSDAARRNPGGNSGARPSREVDRGRHDLCDFVAIPTFQRVEIHALTASAGKLPNWDCTGCSRIMGRAQGGSYASDNAMHNTRRLARQQSESASVQRAIFAYQQTFLRLLIVGAIIVGVIVIARSLGATTLRRPRSPYARWESRLKRSTWSRREAFWWARS